MKKQILTFFILTVLFSCTEKTSHIKPSVITEKVLYDSDDPAIWVNKANPQKSIVFGTDKDETNGGVYAFDLDGKCIKEKSITKLSYPNNVDVEYGFAVNDTTKIDIMAFTEREKHQIRIFSVPDMIPLDKGGFSVFRDEKNIEMRRPTGISLYKNPKTGKISVFISRKKSPEKGAIYQYQIVSDINGNINLDFIRKFGVFSGKKEIEAIAVDDQLGYVYYSDEGIGIRKYYADPEKGNKEISLFGKKYFKRDMEGIAIVNYKDGKGYIIISDQQNNTFNIFRRDDNAFVKRVNLGTKETDGCDVTTIPLGSKFPHGIFVSMNDEKNFYYHDLGKLKL